MFWFGSGVSEPSTPRSNSMKTRFQNSRKRSQSQPGWQSGRSQPYSSAPVVVELRARPARPGIGRLPEVLDSRQADDSLSRNADPLPPGDGDLVLTQAELRVAGEDRRPEALLGEAQSLGHELPGKIDRPVLEIVAEREVAEHLEKGAVTWRAADVVEVVVFSARAHHLLRGHEARRRRLLQSEEVRLQRLHAGHSEERRAVLGRRDDRPGRMPDVTLLLEEGEKALTELRARTHEPIVRAPRAALAAAAKRNAGQDLADDPVGDE